MARSGSQRVLHLRLTLRGLIVVAVATPFVVSGVAFSLGRILRPQAEITRAAAPRDDLPERRDMRRPDWGEFVYRDIVLERPTEFVMWREAFGKPTRWVFPGTPREALPALLADCGMSGEMRERILAKATYESLSKSTVVEPDDATVFAMGAQVRAKLYAILARHDVNLEQAEAFRFPATSESRVFEQSGLSEDRAAKLRRLLYRRGDAICLSDVGPLLRSLPDDESRVLAVKAVSREPSVLMKIVIRPESDIDALLGYWGTGGRAKELEALLDSLSRDPEGVLLDVAHLLPPFARSRLYTYPVTNPEGPDKSYDCFWTSLNFFNTTPDDRFFDGDSVVAEMSRSYVRISGPSRFGDLVMLTNEDDNIIHACVFIADGIVFTKNGRDRRIPWVLARLSDVRAAYSEVQPTEPSYYRRRDL